MVAEDKELCVLRVVLQSLGPLARLFLDVVHEKGRP